MKSKTLYSQLEKDFIVPGLSDDWAKHMRQVQDFISGNFKRRSMGVVCDFARNINRVYTAVFPTREVMQRVLDSGAEDAMLFVHHPAVWDIRRAPEVFQQMNRELLRKFKERRIAIYNLHVPLDNFGPYGTSVTLAEALGIKIERACSPYFGSLSGVIGTTSCKTVGDLKRVFEKAVGHKVKLYPYGPRKIDGERVVVVAGGGNNQEYLQDAIDLGARTVITGISVRNSHSEKTHKYEEENGINVLGGTHYSTERFACMKMRDYFRKLKLPCEFIEGQPIMEDM